MLRVLSLGAGVQSTTVALMIAKGELAPIDCAIFADTGAEPEAVYRHLKWLKSPGVLPFPVEVVTNGYNLRDELLAATRGESKRGSHSRPPFYVRNEDGTSGIVRRQCTRDYKVDPIEQAIRRRLGLRRRQRWPDQPVVEQWMGISRDEATRMRTSSRPAVVFRYPLIDLGMTRRNCLEWLSRNGYPEAPRSACTFCPFHSDREWRRLRDTDPASWQEAVTVDRAIRCGLRSDSLTGRLYLHNSLQPIEDVDLSTAEERGQPNLFENECEGHCGV